MMSSSTKLVREQLGDLMENLHPLLTKRAQGRDISGLRAYEQ